MIDHGNGLLSEFDAKLRSTLSGMEDRLCAVYHLSEDEAAKRIRESEFYQVLSDNTRNLVFDDVEDNFWRLQNEIEYGHWDLKNVDGAAQ